ncbi:MAG: type II secretion system protein [Verrucomicrobiaceae bacterium]|nr:MAG: type II secretion system protein [Verrucomicrobiaceae bacterium]
MMNPSVIPSRPRHAREKGFALVTTLMMLVLLVVISLGLLTLSTVTLRSVSADKGARLAKANARLALQLAIGELQTLAGSDNRVTAPSSLGDGSRAQKNLTGVWEGWKWDGQGSAPDWAEEKEKRFKGWLVSTNKQGGNLEQDFAKEPAGEGAITLVGADDSDAKVEAQLVNLPAASGKPAGGLAWAVFDESQKIDASLSAEEDSDSPERNFDRLTAAHEPGFKAVTTAYWKPLDERKAERSKILSRSQTKLIGVKKEDASFHDLTSGTLGLLTDVAKGGLATDLSTLFNKEELPSDYASRFIYSGTSSPLAPPPSRATGANPLPSPDPTWALLQSHYRSYQRLSGSDNHVDLSVSLVDERPNIKRPVSGDALLHDPSFNRLQLAPVIAKSQFIFSLAFGYGGTLEDMWKAGSARTSPAKLRDTYMTWLVIDPVITLWNPYNVPVRFSSANIELYRIPLAFRLYKNNVLINSNYTRLTNTYTVNDFGDRREKFYLLKLRPETGQDSLVIEPGEHMVFTAHNWKPHGDQRATEEGLLLRPGFNPPAGASSSPEIGGITTMNLFVDSNGVKSGIDYGKSIRTVAVKGGDKIGVEIKPERAGNDKLEEAGGREVTGFMKYYLGDGDQRKLVGGIELDYGDRESELLPAFDRHDLPTIVVDSSIPTANLADGLAAQRALRYKEPFLIATFQQKTERDSRFPSRSWVNNAPTNLYATAGLDQTEDFAHHQFEFKWEPMFDWPPDSPTIEISNERNRGYGGSGVYAQSGTELASFSTLPLAPAHSLGQFTHAPLNSGGQLPLTSHATANSFAPPLLPADKVNASGTRTYLDHSWLANNALFDSNFLSSAADHPAVSGIPARQADDLLRKFFTGEKRLPNSRFKPYLGSESAEEITGRLKDDEESYKHIAANLLLEAPFNVNSTRVAAWEALLASNSDAAAILANGKTEEKEGIPVSRNLPSVGPSFESAGSDSDRAKWTGHRRITEEQVAELAKEVVEEVKKRGPFQSLAEFVNRRPGSGETSRSGALQSAIDRIKLNDSVLDPSQGFSGQTGANAEAGSGNTADGAPGVITQADLLTPLLPQLTARGDTFVIRAYGEAKEPDGRKITAWCEATVQRFPEYVDPSDQPTATPASEVNRTFGRRFHITSFRWLTPGEI